jgi:hypothetical protein
MEEGAGVPVQVVFGQQWDGLGRVLDELIGRSVRFGEELEHLERRCEVLSERVAAAEAALRSSRVATERLEAQSAAATPIDQAAPSAQGAAQTDLAVAEVASDTFLETFSAADEPAAAATAPAELALTGSRDDLRPSDDQSALVSRTAEEQPTISGAGEAPRAQPISLAELFAEFEAAESGGL